MSTTERKAYEAFIEAAKAHGEGVKPTTSTEVIEDLRVTLFARLIEWHSDGAWLPTEQHETVTAMLPQMRINFERRIDDDTPVSLAETSWEGAEMPGLPKPPPEIWGPEITVDTDGRCPVEGDEVVNMANDLVTGGEWVTEARHAYWTKPRTFRRRLAGHPGDSYWHGKREVIVSGVSPRLDIHDFIVDVTTPDGRRAAYTGGPWISGSSFRRWLKGDA